MSEILPGVPRAARAGRVPMDRAHGSAPATLVAVSVTVVLQVVVELAYVASRDGLTVFARVALLVLVAAQMWLVWRALHLSAGGALGLFVTELATGLAVAANTEMAGALRIGLAAAAVLAVVLLAASLPAFPTATLPTAHGATDDAQ